MGYHGLRCGSPHCREAVQCRKWALLCDLGLATKGRVCVHTNPCRQSWSGDSRGVAPCVLGLVPCVLGGVSPHMYFKMHAIPQLSMVLTPPGWQLERGLPACRQLFREDGK